MGVQCKALILKTNSLSQLVTPTLVVAFGKGGILRLCFRKTRQHIATLNLKQMCHLFYLKRASD